ncbi:hypothetical protein AV654_30860 [Paenibacillus elgii]|uniref:Phosphotransferase n=1 Tax=Paenibacillus elgii TaxID=189691 RepID=A0A161S4L8_9BACL|nr:AAA family ATPase [Paenibacillus elgii]KZE73975.1 hypothetical protein AV654_30860 [Paenibacillus elgii]
MKHDEETAIYLITGVMASGKSTVAQLLAEQFGRGVHLRGDAFRRMIVTGREELLPGASEEATRQLLLRHRLAAATADTYADAGFTVVVQDVVIGPMLEEFVSFVRHRPLYVVVLAPGSEAVAAREAARAKKGYGLWTVAGLNGILHNKTPKIGLWLDTSEQTPEETVSEIRRRSAEEAAV